MGLAKGALNVLLAEARRRPLTGRVLTLGRMDVHFGAADMARIAAEAGVTLREPGDEAPPTKAALASKGYVSDRYALKALGFSDVTSLDASAYEGADVIFDLNEPEPPPELLGAFDLLFDGGTLEHVFHLPNALANVHAMLRPGGRVVHVAPSTNHVDHGFVMFSPTFFWDFYTQNEWSVETAQIFRYTVDVHAPWEVSNYEPGCLWRVMFGGLDDALYGVIFVATKAESATGRRIPLQSEVVDSWRRRADEEAAVRARLAIRGVATTPPDETLRGRLRRGLVRGLRAVGVRVVERLDLSLPARRRLSLLAQAVGPASPPPPKGLGLEVIARY